ncbi:MAG TPA: hypothetical protein DEO31_07480 [Streptococcus sp.]|nr:hypothetical protein [Streptococcus sp.]
MLTTKLNQKRLIQLFLIIKKQKKSTKKMYLSMIKLRLTTILKWLKKQQLIKQTLFLKHSMILIKLLMKKD